MADHEEAETRGAKAVAVEVAVVMAKASMAVVSRRVDTRREEIALAAVTAAAVVVVKAMEAKAKAKAARTAGAVSREVAGRAQVAAHSRACCPNHHSDSLQRWLQPTACRIGCCSFGIRMRQPRERRNLRIDIHSEGACGCWAGCLRVPRLCKMIETSSNMRV